MSGQHPWLRPGWKILPTRICYCSNTYCDCRFPCEDNNVAFTNVQHHSYRVRQMEPCHQLEWSSQALILSILALGAMPKQQQQQQPLRPLCKGQIQTSEYGWNLFWSSTPATDQDRAQTLHLALAAKAQKQQFTENSYGFSKRRIVVWYIFP